MIVLEKQKALVLNLRNPERVTAVIPTARSFEHGGQRLLAVHHGIDEATVLRNMGIRAPSPIRYTYDWPRNEYRVKQPFASQIDTAEFLTLHPRSFLLSDIGTGKSLSALWAADYLMHRKKVKKALIVSTLSTLTRVWMDEIMEHFPHRSAVVLHDTRANRLKKLEIDADFYIINHDAVGMLVAPLKLRKDINLIIVDEIAQGFRNVQTKRWKFMNEIASTRPRVWGMTGTPTPNLPTDAYGQIKLVVPRKVPRYFSSFRDSCMQQLGLFRWIPRANAAEVVHAAMQPAIRFSRDEVVDLPECMYETRHADLTPDQERAYRKMLRDLAVVIQGDEVVAANDAIAANKLLQICCGVLYGNHGERVELPNAARLAIVREVIEEATAKVIVFAPFRSVAEWLAKELGAMPLGEGAMIHGGTSKNERDLIFSRFRSDKQLRYIVAHPGCMSHGLTLTEANVIIWFAPLYSNEIYEQANGRIRRPGQKQNQLIVHIESSDLERRIYARLKERQRLQGLLLQMVKQDGG